jgi:hypothetical protein
MFHINSNTQVYIAVIISMFLTIINLGLNIHIYKNLKSSFENNSTICDNKTGKQLEKCLRNVNCIHDVNCALHEQPANRSIKPSHVITGTTGDCSVIGFCEGNHHKNIPEKFENITNDTTDDITDDLDDINKNIPEDYDENIEPFELLGN